MSESKPKQPKLKVTREQLEQAAKLRAEGGTWNEIREATGTKIGSGAFQRHWEREGIDHLPSHADDFKKARVARSKPTDPAQPEGQAKPAESAKAKPSRSRAAKKPPEAEAKPRRTVRRSKFA